MGCLVRVLLFGAGWVLWDLIRWWALAIFAFWLAAGWLIDRVRRV